MKEIQLTKGKVALVDDEDIERLSLFNWYLHQKYAHGRLRGPRIRGRQKPREWMHRFILSAPIGLEVDHINGVTRMQNNWNAGIKKNCSSGYRGVWLVPSGRWAAAITCNNKKTHIGVFRDKEDAALAYNLLAAEYFGEFARYNLPK